MFVILRSFVTQGFIYQYALFVTYWQFFLQFPSIYNLHLADRNFKNPKIESWIPEQQTNIQIVKCLSPALGAL